MDEDGASITDVTEFSADDLENADIDPETSSQLTSSDNLGLDEDSSQVTTSNDEDGNVTTVLAHSPFRMKQIETEVAGMSVDEDSDEKEGSENEQQSSASPGPKRLNRCPGPSPIESFAKGARLANGMSFPSPFLQGAGRHESFLSGNQAGAKPKRFPNQPPKKLFPHELPNFSEECEGHWYDHQCFDHYWQHYHFVSAWCQKHMELYRTVVADHAKETAKLAALKIVQQSFERGKGRSENYTPKRTLRNRKARRRRKLAKQRMRLVLAQAERAGSCSSLLSSTDESQTEEGETEGEGAMAEDDGEEVFVMEISEEMRDFFTQTHKHRLERDAMKKNRAAKEEKRINIEQVRREQKERTGEAPKERPGAKRTSEMRVLYGKGAAMIHGMETALQMNFDRNIDIRQPKMWPNMPFRIIFD